MKKILSLLCLASLLLPGGHAVGTVSQVDGTIVPTSTSLQGQLESDEGVTDPNNPLYLDAIRDAYIFPQIFMPPGCGTNQNVTFIDIQEQAGYENTFGWYNVDDPTTLYRVFTCLPDNDEPRTTKEVDFCDEENQGHWHGGFIGFFLITPEGNTSDPHVNCGDFDPPDLLGHLYYTESELNGDGDYVHFLVYTSKVQENRFYFAFEDLFRGGDNDFTDMTIRVEGLTPPCVPEPEICDGLDNDCDGETDEDPTDAGGDCGSDVGECQPGTLACVNAHLVCQNAVGPTSEVCDGLDNDCNGTADDNPIDENNPCGRSTGECRPGTTQCRNGSLVCIGETGPRPEVCDGLDNDCNGTADDNLSDVGVVCGTDVGQCQSGLTVCVNGHLDCQGATGPRPEVCDGLDNDCNGAVDDDPTDAGAACGSDQGACQAGSMVCINGLLQCQGAVGPRPEVCDGLDNDCNGAVDDDPTDVGGPCGSSEGECRPGRYECVGGSLVCNGAVGPQDEVCDGRDNDCDGQVDEQDPGGGATCGISDQGVCRLGVIHCVAGQLTCDGAQGPSTEECDCRDNDCDGSTDEDAVCPPGSQCLDCECRITCNEGEFQCPGGMSCQDGFCVPTSCYGVDCPEGQVCRDGDCVDVCDLIICDDNETCVNGGCVENNCYGLGCPEGQICRNAQCIDDPCAQVECGPKEFCRDGRCVATCEHVVCPKGQACHDGDCIDDPCGDKDCGWGNRCRDGLCEPDPCVGVTCGANRVCLDGDCIDDPCNQVTCPLGGRCDNGQCIDPEGYVSGVAGQKVMATGAGGCSCGSTGPTDSGSVWMLLLGLVGLILRKRPTWAAQLRPAARNQGPTSRVEPRTRSGKTLMGLLLLTGLATIWSGCQFDPYQFPDIDGYMPKQADGGTVEPDSGQCSPTNGGLEICDGIDNDCNGLTDEIFDLKTDQENCGRCKNSCIRPGAFTACQDGVCQFYGCAPGTYDLDGDPDTGCEYQCLPSAGGEELCDEIDNDCDGQTDEDFDLSSDPDNCGSCGHHCALTNAESVCRAGQCRIDSCHEGFLDLNGDESDGCEYPCSPTNNGVEICDGIDNDCNGLIDDNVDVSSDPDNCGACGNSCSRPHAAMDCQANHCVMVSCEDGFVDINLDPNDGCEYPCSPTNNGIEICDGLDNDCDGVADDNLTDTGGTCGTNEGACQTGTWTCSSGHLVCSGSIDPLPEVCDGVDNDCNGQTDEATFDTGDLCGTNLGACQVGTTVCENGHVVCQGDIGPQPETCDGLDNDCDGIADNNLTDEGARCGVTNVGPCEYGTTRCESGHLVCSGNIDPEPEVCDGIDNDCNGTIDPTGCVTADATDIRLDATSPPGAANSIQVDMAASGDEIHVVWLDRRNGNADIYHTCSTDGGQTWIQDTRLDGGSSDSVKPRVILDASGWVYVAWADFRTGTDRDIYLRRSAGCGQEFEAETRLDSGTVDSLNLDLASDGNGTVAVVWEDFIEGSGTTTAQRNILMAFSTDYGATFTSPTRVNQQPTDPADAYATLPRTAFGASGKAIVVWSDARDGALDIYVNATTDGQTFLPSDLRLDSDTAGQSASKYPQIAADAAGHVYVVWQDLRRGSYSDIYLNRSSDNAATWLVSDMRLDTDKGDADSFAPQISLGQGQSVQVAWQDWREGLPGVQVASSFDGGATFQSHRASSPAAGLVSEIRLASAGAKVFTLWADDRNGLRDIFLNFSLDGGLNFQPTDIRLDQDPSGAAESFSPCLAADGQGGAYGVWVDTRADGVVGDIFFNSVSE